MLILNKNASHKAIKRCYGSMGLKLTEYSTNEKDALLSYLLCYNFLLHSGAFIQILEKKVYFIGWLGNT